MSTVMMWHSVFYNAITHRNQLLGESFDAVSGGSITYTDMQE